MLTYGTLDLRQTYSLMVNTHKLQGLQAEKKVGIVAVLYTVPYIVCHPKSLNFFASFNFFNFKKKHIQIVQIDDLQAHNMLM